MGKCLKELQIQHWTLGMKDKGPTGASSKLATAYFPLQLEYETDLEVGTFPVEFPVKGWKNQEVTYLRAARQGSLWLVAP